MTTYTFTREVLTTVTEVLTENDVIQSIQEQMLEKSEYLPGDVVILSRNLGVTNIAIVQSICFIQDHIVVVGLNHNKNLIRRTIENYQYDIEIIRKWTGELAPPKMESAIEI